MSPQSLYFSGRTLSYHRDCSRLSQSALITAHHDVYRSFKLCSGIGGTGVRVGATAEVRGSMSRPRPTPEPRSLKPPPPSCLRVRVAGEKHAVTVWACTMPAAECSSSSPSWRPTSKLSRGLQDADSGA
eukprot:2726004-Rhodomonas_salina.2